MSMIEYATEHTYSSTRSFRSRRLFFVLAGLVMALAFLCGNVVTAQSKGKNQTARTLPTPEAEYAARFKSVENELAAGDKPYFVLDTKKSRLRLKMRGATMRDYRYILMSDSDGIAAFTKLAVSGDTLPKTLLRVHVFESEKQLNDTVLKIVSEATFAAPEVIQRYRPGHLTATFENRVVLDVHALDVSGSSASWSSNLAEDLRLFADDVLGGETLRIAIVRDDAMSFYGACLNAPALLIAP
jgi:hypothetical protein